MSLLLLFALFFPLQAASSDKCSLSGTVVDSVTGDPLNKVELRLEPAEGQATPVAVTTSDARGRFAMVDLDPGRYHVTAKRRGYLEMSYGEHRPDDDDGAVLRLEAGQTAPELAFKLVPAAVIAGTVRDSDGEPVENAHVSLTKIAYGHDGPHSGIWGEADTDDRGEYRFRGLGPGRYYVGAQSEDWVAGTTDHSANAGQAEVFIPTFYSAAPHLALAAPITVSEGGNVEGVDVTLLRSRVFRVSGRVSNAPAAGLSVSLTDAKNADTMEYPMRNSTKTKNESGDFELRGVPPGAYELSVIWESLRGSASVAVGESDVEGVRVALAAGAEVKGRVTVEGDRKPRLARLALLLTANGEVSELIQVAEDGSFTQPPIPNFDVSLQPGHYEAQMTGSALSGFYAKSIRSGETDMLADGLTVTGPGTIDIEVVLASDVATVEGVVLDKDLQPVTGATIVVAPERRSRMGLFRTTRSDQNGRYEIADVAPGDYKLFAWDDVEPYSWNDPDFLKDYEKQGEKTTLEPKAHATVNLHLATGPAAQ